MTEIPTKLKGKSYCTTTCLGVGYPSLSSGMDKIDMWM